MGPPPQRLTVSTPGRICLFGEHQDYLHLPVIPAAISLRLTIEGGRQGRREMRIDLPDTGSRELFLLSGPLPYVAERDYFRSTVNVLLRHGFTFSGGVECRVHGEIPINAGTSSSSALVVGWVNFLTHMSDQHLQLGPEEIARYAHEAEVVEFGEPGGMMDHCSTAFGGVLSIEFLPRMKVDRLSPDLKTFVLGDSGEPKDTKGILARVKNRVLAITGGLAQQERGFSLDHLTEQDLERWTGRLDGTGSTLLRGTVRNHALTCEARRLMQGVPLDHRRFGELLNEHQAVLRDVLRISTPKIDRMLDAAMNAGAYGGKINGSGGGGCMFAYVPEHPERVVEAVERAGGKGYVVTIDGGTRIEQ